MNVDTHTVTWILNIAIIPVVGFLVRWLLQKNEKAIEAIAHDVRAAVQTLNKHDTGIARLEDRCVALEARCTGLHEKTHELANRIQGIELNLHGLEQVVDRRYRRR